MLNIVESYIFDPEPSFEYKALGVFQYQYRHVAPYRKFVDSLYGKGYQPQNLSEIPLVPVELFRETTVLSDEFDGAELMFRSSGTSSMKRSTHHVAKALMYQQAIRQGISQVCGLSDPIILAYTPGYNENPESSLIYMLSLLINDDPTGKSRFLDVNHPPTESEIINLAGENRPIVLFGAAFGLLDWCEHQPVTLPENAMIMETGGMKTHRREISKAQLRQQLAEGFGIKASKIHSEYGMTEMLSQAYAMGDVGFRPAPTLRVSIRKEDDVDTEAEPGQEGVIGIYDLANLYSCAFFQTADKGIACSDGTFEVVGRTEKAALRGCNFLLEDD